MHRWVALAMAALVASSAQAQDDHRTDDVEVARAYARKGLALYDLGKYAEALEALEAAYQKKAVPALLFNIAQCHRQLGHLEQAARLYKAYLRTDPPEATAQQTRDLLAKVEDALSRQKTAVQSPPHELTGRPQAEHQPAPAAALATAAPPGAPAAPREHRRWPALAAGGVAAGAVALGIVWAAGSRSATNQLAQLHAAGPVDPGRDAALRSDASSQYTRSRVSYVAAAIATAAGVALWFAF